MFYAVRVSYIYHMNIFEKLISLKIPFAVIISVAEFKNPAIEMNGKDYCIVIVLKDRPKVTGNGFEYYNSGGYEVAEKTLIEYDYKQFKKMQGEFTKVLHTRFGRIYEHKDLPFKKYYLSLQ